MNEPKKQKPMSRVLQVVTVVVFVAFIFGLAGLTLLSGRGALLDDLKSGMAESGVEGVVAQVEANFNSEFFAKKSFVEAHGAVLAALGMDVVQDTDPNYNVVKDNHGQLHFIATTIKMQEVAKNIADYTGLGTPILYIQTPVKNIEGYTEYPDNIYDMSNETAEAVLQLMAENNVPTLDLRKAANDAGLEKSTLFYNTDHHWRVETAFWAVGATVDRIEEVFGIEMDAENFYTDMANYTQEHYEQFFLGSQGRRVGRYFGGLDDFTLIYPSFETNYTLTRSGVEKTGNFNEALLDMTHMTTGDNSYYSAVYNVYNNRYATYFGADYDKLTVKNHDQADGPRILLLKDSFSLPYAAFLSTMCSELTLIDLRYYDIADLAGYISASDFDLVMMMYK